MNFSRAFQYYFMTFSQILDIKLSTAGNNKNRVG
jgi:hypothetical protein